MMESLGERTIHAIPPLDVVGRAEIAEGQKQEKSAVALPSTQPYACIAPEVTARGGGM
jgi:hypothetical protein